MTTPMLILRPLACTHEYMRREKHVRRIEQFLIAMTTYLQGGVNRKSGNLQHDSCLVFEGGATTPGRRCGASEDTAFAATW